MLKLILGKSADAKRATQQISEQNDRIKLDWLKDLLEFFPIGKRLRYCPEFKSEIIFDTFVVAYRVNGDFLYAADAIERSSDGYPISFQTDKKESRTHVADLDTLEIVVPNTSEHESKLDYERRALIGRGRQFMRGNSISLTSNVAGRGVSSIDTEVLKQIVLKDGPYAQTPLVLLSPEIRSMVVTDQRKNGRAKICVPTTMSVQGEPMLEPCTLIDISDGAVRVRVRKRSQIDPQINVNDEVVLAINFAEAEQNYTIKGRVVRCSPEICVIRLESFLKKGIFSPFGALDNLELKAALLNHG